MTKITPGNSLCGQLPEKGNAAFKGGFRQQPYESESVGDEDVRWDRISTLRMAIAEGAYRVSASQLADSLVTRFSKKY